MSKPAVEMPGSDSNNILNIQFGDVDWKEVANSASPSLLPEPELKVNTGKFRRVDRHEWKTYTGNILKTLGN